MKWNVVKSQPGVAIGKISNGVAFTISQCREILELLPGLKRREYPPNETPKQATTFISRFMDVKGEFPKIRQDGYIHSRSLGGQI